MNVRCWGPERGKPTFLFHDHKPKKGPCEPCTTSEGPKQSQKPPHRQPKLCTSHPTALQAVKRALPPGALQKCMLNQPFTYASMFSGMGTVEVALERAMQVARSHGLQGQGRLLAVCDWARPCQNILVPLARKHRACCFSDVMHMVSPAARKYASNRQAFNVRIGRVLKHVDSQMLVKKPKPLSGYCLVHNVECRLPDEDLLVGGTSCVDFSKAGLMTGLEGPTSPTLCAYLARARRARVFVHENVDGFPDEPFENLADTHVVYKLVVDTADTGFGSIIARKRIYRIAFRKDVKQAIFQFVRSYVCISLCCRRFMFEIHAWNCSFFPLWQFVHLIISFLQVACPIQIYKAVQEAFRSQAADSATFMDIVRDCSEACLSGSCGRGCKCAPL